MADDKAVKKNHPNWGVVTVIEETTEGTLVQLESGERRTVTTAWLTDLKPE